MAGQKLCGTSQNIYEKVGQNACFSELYLTIYLDLDQQLFARWSFF